MQKIIVRAEWFASQVDGEAVEFAFEYADGTQDSFVATHGVMVEVADTLTVATKDCAAKRMRLGKAYEPMRQDGIVRQFDLSTFAALPGRDGTPRIVFTQDNGSAVVIRLTANDAQRWRDLLDQVIAIQPPKKD